MGLLGRLKNWLLASTCLKTAVAASLNASFLKEKSKFKLKSRELILQDSNLDLSLDIQEVEVNGERVSISFGVASTLNFLVDVSAICERTGMSRGDVLALLESSDSDAKTEVKKILVSQYLNS